MPSSCGRKNNEGDYDKDLLGEEMVGIDISRSSASTFTIRLRERNREGGSQLRSQLTLDAVIIMNIIVINLRWTAEGR